MALKQLYIISMVWCTSTLVHHQVLHAQSKLPYLNWVFTDAGALIVGLDGKTLIYGAGGLGATALLSLLDEPIQSQTQNGLSNGTRKFARTANLFGDPYFAIPASLGVFGLSLLGENRRFQDAAFTSAQTLLYASTAILLLKWVVGRHRPDLSDSAFRFDPFSSNDAFPSGHATAAFALLTPWVLYYPNWITWSLAGLTASSTAFARVALNKHWLSDTIAGAIIGVSMGWVLTRRHQFQESKQTLSQSFTITPVFAQQQRGLRISFQY